MTPLRTGIGALLLIILGIAIYGFTYPVSNLPVHWVSFPVNMAAGSFSPTGDLFLGLGETGTHCTLYAVELVSYRVHTVELCQQDETLSAVEWHPNGHMIVVVPAHSGEVWIVDYDTHNLIHRLRHHTSLIRGATFSGDGRFVVSFDADGTVVLWDASSGNLLVELEGHEDMVTSAEFSMDNRLLMTTSFDQTVRLWDLDSHSEQWQTSTHNATVFTGAFSPDGQYVVTGGADNTARVWDLQTKQELYRYTTSSWVTHAFFSSDSQTIIMSTWLEGAIVIWGFEAGTVVQALSTGLESELLDWTPQRTYIAIAVDNSVGFWKIGTE